ncbi:hypothetical protein Moror_3529 [Moniliophthora roreri MCA 2997]|uniref:Uncharacterized protein n=2 Tax=Moniliophthora roreri TaxID=221103 RepID=V2W2L7_MONRO|nr:hypothetical protein Moror_3529 [Moniliophthora roreri MCA 2997]
MLKEHLVCSDNMFAQVCHLKCKFCWAVPASLPQLPAVCNFFDQQPDQDTFDELHWYAHYMWQALMDLATL